MRVTTKKLHGIFHVALVCTYKLVRDIKLVLPKNCIQQIALHFRKRIDGASECVRYGLPVSCAGHGDASLRHVAHLCESRECATGHDGSGAQEVTSADGIVFFVAGACLHGKQTTMTD